MIRDRFDGGMIHATTQFWEETSASMAWEYAHGKECATPGCKAMVTSKATWCKACAKAQPEHVKAVQEGTRVYQAKQNLLRWAAEGKHDKIVYQPSFGTMWDPEKLEQWIEEAENGNRNDPV